MQFHFSKLMMSALMILGCFPLTSHSRRNAPLIEDDWARKSQRAAECTFGKQVRELGSTWFADLGPPFGIMYCIKCECIPYQKKKRIVARVQCRNIKNECPKLSCDEPVLLPERCCKSCPGEYSGEIAADFPVQLASEEEERDLKHFGVLISSRISNALRRDESLFESQHNTSVNYVVTGRFTFYRKDLYYSFYLSASTPRPRNIQFIDSNGNILEEHEIDTFGGFYQNLTSKLCGVWRRIPRDYRKLLREDRLFVSLTWQNSCTLSGQILKFKGLPTEQFSALMEPPASAEKAFIGEAATAIVSVSLASTPSLHISIITSGFIRHYKVSEIPLVVQLEHIEKGYIVLHEEIIIKKPSNELNFGEVIATIETSDLRLLSRGKLQITLTYGKESVKFSGPIRTRAACDMYQALLIPDNSSKISGFGWAFVQQNGSLRYGINLLVPDKKNLTINMVAENLKKQTVLEDLTSSFVNGYGNGSLERSGPRILDPLFSNQLFILVKSSSETILRGNLLHRPVADARDTMDPALFQLVSQDSLYSNTAGIVWIAVDNECTLHYELEVTGLTTKFNHQNKVFKLYLETMALLAPGAPVSRSLLEEFSTSILDGSVTGLSPLELYRIEAGLAFLEITDKNLLPILKTSFKARAPLSCLPHYTDNDVASAVAYNLHPPHFVAESSICYYEGRFYDEGTQWKSITDKCSMCHCYRSITRCDPIPCPALVCSLGKEIKLIPGQCCPICHNSTIEYPNHYIIKNNATNSTKLGCTLAGQYHSPGSSWHPYLPPTGFDTCALCTCNAETLEVQCPRVQCAPLNCDEKTAIRPDKKACCKQCPIVSQHTLSDPLLKDQAVIVAKATPQEILAKGGCKYPVGGPYENGKEWHPRIHSHGEMKCIKCKCKDGDVKCERKRCTKVLCAAISLKKKKGDLIVDNDACCIAQCRRSRRFFRNNHRNAKATTLSRELS